MLRLRQICLVAPELNKSVAHLESVLGLKTCFHDPGVERFGLKNALLPIGTNFIEIVAPFQDGTTAERFLQRRNGPGGYMVIMQCDDIERRKKRMEDLGVRLVTVIDNEPHHAIQMHPKDTGGAIMETGLDNRGSDPASPWTPAGNDWKNFIATEIVASLTAAELQSDDPEKLASRWSEVLEVPLQQRDKTYSLQLENASLRFTQNKDARGEGLRALDIKVNDRNELVRRARIIGCDIDENSVHINGIYFNLLS